MADVHCAVTAAGAKPTQFNLGALEPLDRARLFLRRASRPLFFCEVANAESLDGHVPTKIWSPQKPVDYFILANSPLLFPRAGNPRCISTAAQKLCVSLVSDPNGVCALESSYRKVRLIMPGG